MVTILPSIGRLPRDVGLYCISVSPTHLTVVPSLYLQSWNIFSLISRSFSHDSCSVNSCNFGEPEGGSEFKIFVPLHIGQHFYPLKIYLFKTF